MSGVPEGFAALQRYGSDITAALLRFTRLEAASAFALLTATILALVVANSPLNAIYMAGLAAKLGPSFLRLSVEHWINDTLMVVFFLLVGLEIKREIVEGELSSIGKALLPLLAAIGGMAFPLLIYLAVNAGNPQAMNGWAIPIATDIAFALGIQTLLGPRALPSLKVFLTALAVLDDLFVILIIAVFYAIGLQGWYLGFAALGLLGLVAMNRLAVARIWPYLVIGVLVWFLVLRSGVHATAAGVLIALTVPARLRPGAAVHAPLHRLENILHPWVAWLIMPVFAFANAGVSFASVTWATITGSVAVGTMLGLFVGKQAGIMLATWLAQRSGLVELPAGAGFRHVHGVSAVCGVGFTMSLFITSLAFPPGALETAAKIGILAGSVTSGLFGYALLNRAYAADALPPATKP